MLGFALGNHRLLGRNRSIQKLQMCIVQSKLLDIKRFVIFSQNV
ncbi:MAG: hypothetical protein NVSMB31_20200 [Vulcanimicrobiaceae bacterium]